MAKKKKASPAEEPSATDQPVAAAETEVPDEPAADAIVDEPEAVEEVAVDDPEPVNDEAVDEGPSEDDAEALDSEDDPVDEAEPVAVDDTLDDEPSETDPADEDAPVEPEEEPEEEPADDLPVDEADELDDSPAPTTRRGASYQPPPPYDPNATPSAPAPKPAAPGFVEPMGADYMLASTLGTRSKKKRQPNRMPLLIGAAILVVALVVGIIVAAPAMFPGLFGPARNATPKAAVESYLNALAAGDASTALSTAVAVPAQSALLTNDLLKSSQQRAPITNIVVKDATGSTSAMVSATYQIGGKPVTASFPTQKVGNEWRLVTITRDVQLTGIDKVKVTLNAIPISVQGHLTVFPGSYVIASANDRLMVDGGAFVVQSPSDFANPTMNVSISDKGLAEAQAAADVKLTSCLKKKDLAPAGCGYGVAADGVKVKSVTWRVLSGAGALKHADFKATGSEPYLSTVYPYVQLQATVRDKAGREYTGRATITTAKADLSGPEVVVTFNG